MRECCWIETRGTQTASTVSSTLGSSIAAADSRTAAATARPPEVPMVKAPLAVSPVLVRPFSASLALLRHGGRVWPSRRSPPSAAPLADPTGRPLADAHARPRRRSSPRSGCGSHADKSNVPGRHRQGRRGRRATRESFTTGADGKVRGRRAAARGDYVVHRSTRARLPDKTLGPAINPLKITIAQRRSGRPGLLPARRPGGGLDQSRQLGQPLAGIGRESGGGQSTDYFCAGLQPRSSPASSSACCSPSRPSASR